MKKIIHLLFLIPSLFLCFSAKAALVGIYIHQLDNNFALEISLSDTTKADIETGLSECESKGMWRVFIRVAQAGHPTTTGYAIGCWYVNNQEIFIESTRYIDKSPFNATFPSSSFQTPKEFKGWSAYQKYSPLTTEQANQRRDREAKTAANKKAVEDNKELTGFIEHQIQCSYAPFPYEQIRRLKVKGLLEEVVPGRTPVYKLTKELKIFGKNLLFVSGGGMDGSTEDFITPPKQGITYIPTHFAITLDSMPDSNLIMTKNGATSKMQFIKQGALDGSESGITITCGYRL